MLSSLPAFGPLDPLSRLEIDASRWLSPDANLLDFDHAVHEREDAKDAGDPARCVHFVVVGEPRERALAAPQVVLRYQRLLPFHNKASRSEAFRTLRACHAALHDLRKPLVRADFEHALDVWQWVLRLQPAASFALQAAALFHDVERLLSEPDTRIEQHAKDYAAFKHAHAAEGARLVSSLLHAAGVEAALLSRTVELVRRHEAPSSDPELGLLNDADALSFFSVNSAGFLAYYGVPHTRNKIAYTLSRMTSRARRFLRCVRLSECVAGLLSEAQRAEAQRTSAQRA